MCLYCFLQLSKACLEHFKWFLPHCMLCWVGLVCTHHVFVDYWHVIYLHLYLHCSFTTTIIINDTASPSSTYHHPLLQFPLPPLPCPLTHQTQPWPTDRQWAQMLMYSVCAPYKFFFSFFFFLLTILITFLDYDYLVTMGPTTLSHPMPLPLPAPACRVMTNQ